MKKLVSAAPLGPKCGTHIPYAFDGFRSRKCIFVKNKPIDFDYYYEYDFD